jgi:6,7-dimethyl-8-ribityllumazine synthase
MATPRRKLELATAAQKKALKAARVMIVESRYYEDIAAELLKGATRALDEAGVTYDVFEAQGALEIPAAVAIAFDGGRKTRKAYDGAVALGCVIRGETSHYDIVAGDSARALVDFSVANRFPIGNGILTVDTDAQAKRRADTSKDDKGGGAARAVLSLIALNRQFERKKR